MPLPSSHSLTLLASPDYSDGDLTKYRGIQFGKSYFAVATKSEYSLQPCHQLASLYLAGTNG